MFSKEESKANFYSINPNEKYNLLEKFYEDYCENPNEK